jgi:hypothetical protein
LPSKAEEDLGSGTSSAVPLPIVRQGSLRGCTSLGERFDATEVCVAASVVPVLETAKCMERRGSFGEMD